MIETQVNARKRLNLNLLIIPMTFLICPAQLWAYSVTTLDCGDGYSYEERDGTPRSHTSNLTDGSTGTASVTGYVDGGTISFGSSLSINANNYQLAPDSWWQVSAWAGWQETITFYGNPAGWLGSLELTYTVKGSVDTVGGLINNEAANFPIGASMYIKGAPDSGGGTSDSYWYMWDGLHDHVFTKVIPFTFETPQEYAASLRSNLLMNGQLITGNAYADFSHTAVLSQLRVLDQGGADITSRISMTTESGEIDPFGLQGSTPVPEPATMLLFGTGIVGLVTARRRKKAC